MLKRAISGAMLLLPALFLVDSAIASGSMRCGTHIIDAGGRHGPGKYEVLQKCGEPTARYGYTWIYDQPGRIRTTLHFDASGMLSRIETESI